MHIEVRTPHGEVLFTRDELRRALARQAAARILPDWMQALVWPQGMVEAMRTAWDHNHRPALRDILHEARMLADAERAGLTTAARAIRHQLRLKYPRVSAVEGALADEGGHRPGWRGQ